MKPTVTNDRQSRRSSFGRPAAIFKRSKTSTTTAVPLSERRIVALPQ